MTHAQAMRTEPMTETDTETLLSTLRRDGFVTLENWITGDALTALKAEVEALESAPPAWARVPDKDHGFILHFAPMTARQHDRSGAVSHIAEAFNDPAFRNLCDGYLGGGWVFDRIILERDFPRPEAIAPWHVDHFPFAERCLKFFIYLSDTNADTGAFSYVPGWHNLVRALSGELPDFRARQDALHWYEQIVDAARTRSDRLKAQGRDEEADGIDRTLEGVRGHIHSADASDDRYSIAARAGSVIVFDPAGLHRGGVVRQGGRLIVRSHCLEAKMARVLSSRNEMVVFANRNVARLVDGLRGRPAFV